MSYDEFKNFNEIQHLIRQAPAPLRGYIEFLEARFDEQTRLIELQTRQIAELTNRIKELENRLGSVPKV